MIIPIPLIVAGERWIIDLLQLFATQRKQTQLQPVHGSFLAIDNAGNPRPVIWLGCEFLNLVNRTI